MTEESQTGQIGEDVRAPARREPRDSMFLIATINSADGVMSCKGRIRNLSKSGMMAECDSALPNGIAVTFELRGVGPVTGKIVWSKDKRVGVRFDGPIDPALTRKTSAGAGNDGISVPYRDVDLFAPKRPGISSASGFRKG